MSLILRVYKRKEVGPGEPASISGTRESKAFRSSDAVALEYG